MKRLGEMEMCMTFFHCNTIGISGIWDIHMYLIKKTAGYKILFAFIKKMLVGLLHALLTEGFSEL